MYVCLSTHAAMSLSAVCAAIQVVGGDGHDAGGREAIMCAVVMHWYQVEMLNFPAAPAEKAAC